MITRAILIFIALMSSMTTFATEFKEGEHYWDLADSVPASYRKDGVTEFFSFYCQACFVMRDFQDRFDDEVEYSKYHVNFIGNRDSNLMVTEAYAASIVLGMEQKFRQKVFEQNFILRKPIRNRDDLDKVLQDIGIEQEAFESSRKSFQAKYLIRRMSQLPDTFNVQSTPTYIVGGRYKINNMAFRQSTDPVGEINNLINFLLKK